MTSIRVLSIIALFFFDSAHASGRSQAGAYCSNVDVPQGMFFLAPVSEVPVIASTGASTCVLLTLYDPRTKLGLVAHVSAGVDVEKSLDRITQLLSAKGVRLRSMEARLIGGLSGFSELMVSALKKGLKKRRVSIVEEDVLFDPFKAIDLSSGCVNQSWSPIKSVVLDLGTGKALDIGEESKLRARTCPLATEWTTYLPLVK